jgi:hypothetical protein
VAVEAAPRAAVAVEAAAAPGESLVASGALVRLPVCLTPRGPTAPAEDEASILASSTCWAPARWAAAGARQQGNPHISGPRVVVLALSEPL